MVNYLNRNFCSAVSVFGLDDGECPMLVFLVVNDILVNLAAVALRLKYLAEDC